MGSNTNNFSLYKPAEGEDGWAQEVNDNWDTIDANLAGKATSLNVTTQTTDYTASDGDRVLADASGGAITITLPGPNANDEVAIKKIDSGSNTVTIATPNTETIDGQSSISITGQYISRTIVSDGSDYFIV